MLLTTMLPQPTDYQGTLWALAGVRGLRTISHGTSGCTFYDFIGFRELNPTRWAGPLFTTGLTETEIVTGGDDRLAAAILEVDRRYQPELIAIVNLTVAALMGADPQAVARELQPAVGARLIAFTGGGMQGAYTRGAADALAALASEWAADGVSPTGDGPAVNLIGPTYETFNLASDMAEVRRLLGLLGVRVRMMTGETDLSEWRSAGGVHLNLVLRDVGLPAAQVLERRFGTPYLYGMPFGTAGTGEWLLAVAKRLGITDARQRVEADARRYQTRLGSVSPWRDLHGSLRFVVSAPYDYALGLTRLLVEEWHLNVPLVILPVAPLAPGAQERLGEMGVGRILVEPAEEELRQAVAEVAPHVLLSSVEDSRLAPAVPVHIRAAHPRFDHATFYDGTPFMGHRGVRWLAQSLVNAMYAAGPADLRI